MPSANVKKELKTKLKECTICGEPTEKTICKTCELIKKLKKESKTKNKTNTKKKYNKHLTCATTKYN